MRWGKKRGGNPDSLEDRYRALARLIERRGFEPRGLMLIEVDGGYVIRGIRGRGRTTGVASDTIALDELLAEIEELPD
jgi:hypothetical protein